MKFKKFTFITLLIIAPIIFALAVFPARQLFAEESEEFDQEAYEDLQDKIKEYEEKIANLHKRGQSLQSEIEYATTQISLTQFKIQNAVSQISQKTAQIEELSQDIEKLGSRIDNLKSSIEYQDGVLSERKRAHYKVNETTPSNVELFLFLISPAELSQKIKTITYSKVMQERDEKLLVEMRDTRLAYKQQRTLYEDKKSEEELLKNQLQVQKVSLDNYRVELDNQKIEKEKLLEDTQNDEAKYQELLRKAQAEMAAIADIVSGIDFTQGKEVDKGDIIAVMGNTGEPDCSTGPHLHFEMRKDGGVVNAEKYLKRKSLYVYHYSSGVVDIGSGDWDWPMKNPVINQRFGKTPWSNWYASGLHSGIDMESSDIFIYAPKGGTLVTGQMGCYSSVIKYAAINHGDGLASYYLHVK